jgi:hypothetical protein
MSVGAVVVDRDFHVGFCKFCCVRQTEKEVLDAEAALQPHTFVVSLDGA